MVEPYSVTAGAYLVPAYTQWTLADSTI